MLEHIYDDIVCRFHQTYNQLYSESDSVLEVEAKLQKAKALTKVERLEFYLSTFFHHLQMDGSNLEIEIYKKLNGTPSKQRQQKKTIIRFVNTFNKECLRLENYDFSLLFKKVRPKMLLQMFVSLLHERKIILIHNESSQNALLIEALISLLYPLQWNFTNISYMIPSMIEYLEAPFPYIIGVPRDLWKQIYETKWDILGEEVIAFDLDNHRVIEKEELPEFPQPYTQLLIKQLEIQLEKSKQIQINSSLDEQEKQREENKFWNNFTLKVKQQFLNFLIFLINTFENFYIQQQQDNQDNSIQETPNAYNIALTHQKTATSTLDNTTLQDTKPQIKHNQSYPHGASANDIFNFDEYVQNVRENKSFFEKFVRTQAFINFIEQAFYEEQGNINDASIRFFKECTRKLAKENIQAVRSMQDSLIQSLMHKYNNRSISYSVDKCHQLYEKALRINMKDIDELIASKVCKAGLQSTKIINKKSGVGLINKFNHEKIVRMTAFDPIPHIKQQYMKGEETYYQINKLNQQSSKKHIVKLDLNILNNSIEVQCGIMNQNEYFSAQITPTTNLFRTQKQEAEQNMNKTQQHIKIDDEHQTFSPDKNIIDLDQEQEELDREGQGLIGFFRKTLSSMKKTLFTQKTQRKQSPSKDQFDESPDMSKVKAKNQTRQGRSQTFHVKSECPTSSQPTRRDRKNNDSFFANLMNLATSKKDRKEDEDQDIKCKLNNTTDLRLKRQLNGSGFFVFNEEDMKNMTEMSPRNKTSNQRGINMNLDYNMMEGQLSYRQQPTIKSPPSCKNQIQIDMSNRIRSISYQNQDRPLNQVMLSKNNKIMDLINESSSSINLDDSQIIHCQQPARFTFAGPKIEISQSSPIRSRESRQNPQQIINNKHLHFITNSNYGSSKKDTLSNKKEFEEIYKKSTENLFYAPPTKNLENRYKEKYNIWKSQTGRLEQPKAPKPPKHQNFGTTTKRNSLRESQNIKSANPKNLALLSPKSARLTLDQKSQSQSQSDKVREEQKVTPSENNTTDEDLKAPILGKNLNEFNKIMEPFDLKINLILVQDQQQQKSSQPEKKYYKHKRQMSSGNSQLVKGETIHNFSPQENIDPDESETKFSQPNNKQIESMQIGRVRRKSKNQVNTYGFVSQNKQNTKSQVSSSRKESVNKQTSATKIKKDSSKLFKTNRTKPSSSPSQFSQIKDELSKQTQKLVAKLDISKAVQSSSTSSQQSQIQSQQQIQSQVITNAVNDRKKEISKYIMKKSQQQSKKADTQTCDDFQSQSEVLVHGIHNKAKIDFRDIKKGEILQLCPQGPRSPQHYTTNNMQIRLHSLSQYDDKRFTPNKLMMGQYNMQDLNDGEQSKLSAFRSNLKPLNKITWEAFSQIAKLSGDVDHEPSTPQSGANLTLEDNDDLDV